MLHPCFSKTINCSIFSCSKNNNNNTTYNWFTAVGRHRIVISFSLEFGAQKFKHLGITSPSLELGIIMTESRSWQDKTHFFLTRFCYSETLQRWSENICRCLNVIYSCIYLHFSYAMLNFLIFAKVEQKSQGLKST